MANLDVRVDARTVIAMLDRVPQLIRRDLRSRFRTLGQTLRNELRMQIPKASGRARRAIFSKFDRVRDRNDIAILVGGNLAKAPHLAIIERGGRIRAKTAQFLAVPVGRMADRHGRAKARAKDVRSNPRAFGYERTWVHNDVVLGERPSGAVEPLFVLTREVVFPRSSSNRPIRRFRDRNESRIVADVEHIVAGSIRKAAAVPGGPRGNA